MKDFTIKNVGLLKFLVLFIGKMITQKCVHVSNLKSNYGNLLKF